ncbi:uncharacterized protein LOC132048989 [Lycium ferocissimum]|uniref:uncharacterized protein LOC132048989 n=1 Tax=Lycium ferocissimum TaxID=112874 RepID=UPI00281652C5|nr:uncharacterized protein LOC132048989 [Lycium ferocissimum]
MSFRQKGGENLYQAWERFKGLLRDCPHHHQKNEVLAHTFIESLDAQHKSSLDTAAGGFTQSTLDWQDDAASSSIRKAPGVFEVDNFTTLSAQLDAMRTEIKKLTRAKQAPPRCVGQQAFIFCEVRGEGHNSDGCPANPASIYFVGNASKGQGNNNQHGNSYNPNWRNHSNFRWSDNPGNQKQNYQPAPAPQAPTNSIEEMTKKMIGDMQKMMIDQQKLIADNQNHDLTVGNLERELEEVTPNKTSRVEAEKEKITEEMIEEERVIKTPVAKQPQPVVEKPPPPFPQCLGRQKEEATYKKFLDLLKQSRFTEYATVALTEECTSRIQNRLPTKLKDPESFTIEISIGKQVVARALCDLGASINLMPSSIFRKLGLGVPRPTTIVLQLADRSLAKPEGIIEDVLVQVGSLIIPASFVILDFKPDPEVSFILGRPFLATRRALIDVATG